MSGASKDDVLIELASWQDAAQRDAMFGIRTEVFVLEQHVPMEEELDGQDPMCCHVLARDADGRPIGTARMQQDGHIGRIAVVKHARKGGVGTRLVHALLARARAAGLEAVELGAQVQAIGFYETLGFVAEGGLFLDAGIPHRKMVLRLEDAHGVREER